MVVALRSGALTPAAIAVVQSARTAMSGPPSVMRISTEVLPTCPPGLPAQPARPARRRDHCRLAGNGLEETRHAMIRRKIDPPRGVLRTASAERRHFRHERYHPSRDLESYVEHYWVVEWDLRGGK